MKSLYIIVLVIGLLCEVGDSLGCCCRGNGGCCDCCKKEKDEENDGKVEKMRKVKVKFGEKYKKTREDGEEGEKMKEKEKGHVVWHSTYCAMCATLNALFAVDCVREFFLDGDNINKMNVDEEDIFLKKNKERISCKSDIFRFLNRVFVKLEKGENVDSTQEMFEEFFKVLGLNLPNDNCANVDELVSGVLCLFYKELGWMARIANVSDSSSKKGFRSTSLFYQIPNLSSKEINDLNIHDRMKLIAMLTFKQNDLKKKLGEEDYERFKDSVNKELNVDKAKDVFKKFYGDYPIPVEFKKLGNYDILSFSLANIKDVPNFSNYSLELDLGDFIKSEEDDESMKFKLKSIIYIGFDMDEKDYNENIKNGCHTNKSTSIDHYICFSNNGDDKFLLYPKSKYNDPDKLYTIDEIKKMAKEHMENYDWWQPAFLLYERVK